MLKSFHTHNRLSVCDKQWLDTRVSQREQVGNRLRSRDASEGKLDEMILDDC